MPSHTVTVRWLRDDQAFTDNRYSRAHTWHFDGGTQVPASSSPHVVPLPYSKPDAVDPEEAFLASLSSCHMLWFLSIAAGRGFRVDSYVDDAVALMGRNASGKVAVTRVTLHPSVAFDPSNAPTKADIESMHHEAHDECYIANSVTTEVLCVPVD
jgi:organic hydroperoxide reductase OsmC/OhrA